MPAKIYHFVSHESADTTVCGISLTDIENYQTDREEPQSLLDPCKHCQDQARDSESMTNKGLAEWIGHEVGFTIENTSVPSYFDKEQLVLIRDHMLEISED